VLVVLQIAIGVIAHSQALVADGIHSLADLVSDFVVLLPTGTAARSRTPITITVTAAMKPSRRSFWARC
jgi:divalent metal cation (Fe/Co/Zn/Cd) transporter